jgi:hypothetical protein
VVTAVLLDMADVFGSTPRVVVTTFLSAAVGGAVVGWLVAIDRDTNEVSLATWLVGGLAYAVYRTARELERFVSVRRDARRRVGPRFDTDRPALARALRTGELPADPSLDEPLMAAIGIARRRPSWFGEDAPAWLPWGLGIVVCGLVVGYVGLPWGPLVLVLPALAGWRRLQEPSEEPLITLHKQAMARRGIAPASSGGLTYADLRG